MSQLKEMEKKKKRGKENRETGLKKKGAKLLRDVSVLLKKVNESRHLSWSVQSVILLNTE